MAEVSELVSVYEQLGIRLKLARTRVPKTQEQAAEKIGKDPITIWRYETGRAKIRLDDLGTLGAFYGVTVAWLLGEEGAPEPIDPLASRVAELPEEYRAVVEAMVDLERKGRKPAWGR